MTEDKTMDKQTGSVANGDDLIPFNNNDLNIKATSNIPLSNPTGQEVILKIETPSDSATGRKFSLVELIRIIMSKTWFIILVAIVFSIISFFIAYWRETRAQAYSGVTTTLFAYGFPNAELGLDPLGNPLNVHAIRSPHLISLALDSLDLRARGILPEDIRANLVTSAVHANAPLAQIRRLEEMLNPGERLQELIDDIVYHPTQFTLALYRTGALEMLTPDEIAEFLTALLHYYTEYFVASYNELTFLNTIATHLAPRDHDFFELVDILDIAVANMISHLSLLEELYPDFRSHNTSRTFGELLSNVEILRRVSLGGLRSEISRNSLSRDRQRAADILEHRVFLLSLNEQVLRENAASAIYLASEVYNPEPWLFPYHDSIQETFRNDTVYNHFLRSAQDNISEANRIAADIIIYQDNIDVFRHGTPPSAEIVKQVEESITTLFEDLAELEELTNQTINDLIVYDLYRDAVRILAPPVFTAAAGINTMFIILVALIGALMGIFISVSVVVYRYIFL